MRVRGVGAALPPGVLCAQVQTEFTPDNWHLFQHCSVVVGMHPVGRRAPGVYPASSVRGSGFVV